jgi:1,2-diacylglycerol 3-alpha-glucosyltransferase
VRIGIFTNCYLPMVNGVVGAIGLLKRGFEEQGHETHIFAPAFDDYRDTEERVYRYLALDLTKEVKYPVAVPFSWKIQKIIDSLALDLIHCHHPFVLGPAGHKAARGKRIPTIYTFHTQYEQYSHYIPLPLNLVNWLSKRKIRNFCQSVAQITTPAESARELLISYGVTNPVAVIPNPTLLATAAGNGGAIRARYGLERQRVLITIGRIAAEKNLGLLLKSYRHILNRIDPGSIRLMIVGDGPELEKLKQTSVALGLDDRVIFTGLVTPAEVPQYLAAADLFLMTSLSEVKPLSQLEALAAGVPLISVKAPGANDTIVDAVNGRLVPDDPVEIGEVVLQLLADEIKLARYKKAARRTAERYSHSKIAAEYLELFERTISKYQ